ELRRPGPPLPGSPRRQAKSGESTSSRLTHPIGRARPGKAGLAACWSVSIAQRHAQVPSLLEVLVDHRLGTRGDLADHGGRRAAAHDARSEEHTSELQSRENLVCRLLLEKKKSIAP